MAHRIYSRLAQVLIRHPLLIVSMLLTVTAVSAVMATHVRHDFSVSSMFAGNDGLVETAEAAKQTFGHEDATMLVVLEATGRRDVLDKAALTWQTTAARRLDALAETVQIRSLPTMEYERMQFDAGSWLPHPVTVPLVESLPVDGATEAAVRGFFDRNKLAEGALLSKDRTVAAMAVTFSANDRSLDSSRKIVGAVRHTLADIPLPEGYRTHLSGLPVLRVDVVDNLQADQSALLPLAGVIYFLVLMLMLRRMTGSLLLLGVVGMGMAWTLALMALTGSSFNLISNILPMLLMVLAVSDGVHVLSRYAEETALHPENRCTAAMRTIAHVGGACLLTFLTNAIGFLSLWTVHSEAIRAFALQSAVGMTCLYIAIMIALGVALPFFRPARPAHNEWWLPRLFDHGFGRLTTGIVRHPVLTLGLSVAVIGGSVYLARDIQANSYTIETYDEDHPTLQSLRLVENKLGGLLPLSVVLTTDRPGQFLEPETVRQVAAAQAFAIAQPEVLSSQSYVDLHRGVDERISGPTDGVWPPLGEEGHLRLERSEQLLQRVAEEANYDSFLTADGTQARLRLRIRDVGTRNVLALTDRLNAEFASIFPAGSGITAQVTGDAYVNARAMDTMIRELFWSLVTASLTVFGVMAVLLRSVRLGLISAIPNLTPLCLTLGYMGLRGFDMNAGNVIVFTISVGIAVNDTIHFLHRFLEEQRRTGDVAEAVRVTAHSSGRPIVMTSALIILGLAVLLLSDFVPTRRFAELTMVTMGAALLGDLLQLPACLVLFAKPLRGTATEDETETAPHPALLPEGYSVAGASLPTT